MSDKLTAEYLHEYITNILAESLVIFVTSEYLYSNSKYTKTSLQNWLLGEIASPEVQKRFGLAPDKKTVNDALLRVINLSSYIAFCEATNANGIAAAFGKNNEDLVHFLGIQMAMYGWFKGTNKVTYPFGNLKYCDTLANVYANRGAFLECMRDAYIKALIDVNDYASGYVYSGASRVGLYTALTKLFGGGMGNMTTAGSFAYLYDGTVLGYYGGQTSGGSGAGSARYFQTPTFNTGSHDLLNIAKVVTQLPGGPSTYTGVILGVYRASDNSVIKTQEWADDTYAVQTYTVNNWTAEVPANTNIYIKITIRNSHPSAFYSDSCKLYDTCLV